MDHVIPPMTFRGDQMTPETMMSVSEVAMYKELIEAFGALLLLMRYMGGKWMVIHTLRKTLEKLEQQP